MRREEEGIKRKSKKKKRRVDQLRGGEQERRILASTIPHICHFFTRLKFLENKIYTEKTRKLQQNTQ